MALPVPFSPAHALLCLALPGTWLLGRALVHAVTRNRAVRAVLPFGVALAAWLLAVHVASLAFHSLRAGLPAGTLFSGVLGVFAELARRRRAPQQSPEGQAPSRWMILSAGLATLAMAPLALGFHFHDEVLLNGHLSIAAQLQNGIYPPRHLTFPDTPLRYHYGFDLVSASLTALLHLPVDRAIDAATLGLFALAWCLFWTLGERLVGRPRAFLVPLLALSAGGVPVWCSNPQTSLVGRVLNVCKTGTHDLNPPVPSYFFQHPWALGIPLGLTAILLFTARQAPREPVRLAALALVLAALSLGQMTLFVAFLPSFLVASAWGPDGFEPRRVLRMFGVAVVSVVAARLLGGFFASAPNLPDLHFVLHAGFGNTPRETLLWNLQTFGLLLPIGACGFVLLRRDRVLFGLLAAGSLVVINAIRYEGSADIMKYATLATLALAVMSSAAIARWWPGRTSARPRPPPWRTALVALAAASMSLSGLVFVALIAANSKEMPGWMRLSPGVPTAADEQAIASLRGRIGAGELVYRNATHTYAYAQWGGLPQPWIQWTVRAFGFSKQRIATREALVRGTPRGAATYAREGFRFFVLDESHDDRALRAQAEQWIEAGQARREAEIEDLWVVELLPP